MHNILITTSTFGRDKPELLDRLKDHGLQVVLNPFGRKLTEVEALELIERHQPVGMIAGVEPLTQQVLEKAQTLKVISRCGIGMDSVDLNAAENLGLVVINTPDGPTIAVAELALGLILALLRQIHTSDAGIRKGEWVRPMGKLLYGKTVGLIGCGRIGYYLTKLLSSFGAGVLGCDPGCRRNEYCTLVPLDDLFSQSDIITLHIPYSKENHNFINRERIDSMKKGAVLINAARGGILDEEALYDALVSGRLSGAALDCFEQEPYAGPLKDLDNVLLTGHIGSYAKEARVMMETQAVENLLRELETVDIDK
jgi:D-3-phosphoglycerate dehydrogenase